MDISLHRRMLALALGVALVLVAAVLLPKAVSAAPPAPAHTTLITVGSCDFPVRIDTDGKAKPIELPGGRMILTSPGLRATLTNLAEPANQVSYLITGAYHQTELANGDLVVVTTGRALLFDQSFGMFLTVGRFTFRLDDEGSFVQPPTGKERKIDVCERLK
jgi:hypothetical protein